MDDLYLETIEARIAQEYMQNMIFAGLVAAKQWQVNLATVQFMFVPLEAGWYIYTQGKGQEETVVLQRWQREDGLSVHLAYSKTCDILAIGI